VVSGVGPRPFAGWDCEFESRRRCGCLSLVNVVCCIGTGLCDGPIPCPGKYYRVYIISIWSSATATLYTYNEEVEDVRLKIWKINYINLKSTTCNVRNFIQATESRNTLIYKFFHLYSQRHPAGSSPVILSCFLCLKFQVYKRRLAKDVWSKKTGMSISFSSSPTKCSKDNNASKWQMGFNSEFKGLTL